MLSLRIAPHQKDKTASPSEFVTEASMRGCLCGMTHCHAVHGVGRSCHLHRTKFHLSGYQLIALLCRVNHGVIADLISFAAIAVSPRKNLVVVVKTTT